MKFSLANSGVECIINLLYSMLFKFKVSLDIQFIILSLLLVYIFFQFGNSFVSLNWYKKLAEIILLYFTLFSLSNKWLSKLSLKFPLISKSCGTGIVLIIISKFLVLWSCVLTSHINLLLLFIIFISVTLLLYLQLISFNEFVSNISVNPITFL